MIGKLPVKQRVYQSINYFDSRTTSGVVEGINNRLKLIKCSGYDFRNFDNFQLYQNDIKVSRIDPLKTLPDKDLLCSASNQIGITLPNVLAS